MSEDIANKPDGAIVDVDKDTSIGNGTGNGKLTKVDRIIAQASSGRWLLTVMSGIALMMLTYTYCVCLLKMPDKQPLVSGEALFSLITMVFVSYFQRKESSGKHPDEF